MTDLSFKCSSAKCSSAAESLLEIIFQISPFDLLEEEHITDTLRWIGSGASIYRLQKPDVPKKHLVSYFVLLDEKSRKILVVDHKAAGLWLPPGGHVEMNEFPRETVRRECLEELRIEADFWCESPIFLTSTETVGATAGHTDVSLWYVLKGKACENYDYDKREFYGIQWFHFDSIPFEISDPHMKRFIGKLKKLCG